MSTENAGDRPTIDAPSPQPGTGGKQPYEAPRLIAHGNVATITQKAGQFTDPGGGSFQGA